MDRKVVGKGKFYVYVLKWSDVYYVGSKTGKNSNHKKLLVEGGYFTSSKTVKKYLKDIGFPEKIKIILFEDASDAYEYETRYLKRVDARRNSKFLNLHNNEGTNILVSREMLRNRKKGRFPATNGVEVLYMFNTDPRYISGEYWHVTKGRKCYINSFGEIFYLHENDERILSENLTKHSIKPPSGIDNPLYGTTMNEETINKMKQSRLEKYDGKYSSGEYNWSIEGRSVLVHNMKNNNPMKNPDIAERVGQQISERCATWDHWYKWRFEEYFPNHLPLETYIVENIKTVVKEDLIKLFGVERRKAKQVIDRFKEKYNASSI